jgi:hypothetical protein
VPVGDGLEDPLIEPFAKFHHPFLMTGGAEMVAKGRKRTSALVSFTNLQFQALMLVCHRIPSP